MRTHLLRTAAPRPALLAAPVKALLGAALVTSLATMLVATNVRAADWVMLGGSEEGKPEQALTPIGFLQIGAESTPFAEPLEGLRSPALSKKNGEEPTFNIEGPGEILVRRARLGARGTVPHTGGALTYFVAIEAGQNGATRGRGVNLMDASVTLHAIPGVRLRAGQFKLPLMDETLEATPYTADFIHFSPVVAQLVLEQPVVDGAFAGPGFANRDVGVMAFDSFMLTHANLGTRALELSYALMVSQGQTGALDPDPHKDVSARVQLSLLADARARNRAGREELSLFAWRLQGDRVMDGADVARVRQGAGIHARAFGLRARAELVRADGMLFVGATPPVPGAPLVVDPEGAAWGTTIDVGVERFGPLELDVRLGQLSRYGAPDPRARMLRNVTFGAQWKWSESAKLLVSYELRHIQTPADAPADVVRLSESIADLVAVQLTFAL